MKKKLVGNKIITKNKILVFSLIFSNYHFRREKKGFIHVFSISFGKVRFDSLGEKNQQNLVHYGILQK